MSTVFYGYSISKKDFWPFLDKMRAWYKEDSMSALLVRHHHEAIINEQIDYWKARDRFKNKDFHVSIQLFDKDDLYIFRVLEVGYQFMNDNKFPEVKEVFYDSRTDIPPEHEPNKEIVDWIDEEIRKKHFLIATVVDDYDMDKWLFDLAHQWRKNNV